MSKWIFFGEEKLPDKRERDFGKAPKKQVASQEKPKEYAEIVNRGHKEMKTS